MAEQDTPPSGSPAVPPETSPNSNTDAFAERPELFVGAAFVGGLVLAQLLKRIGQ